MRILRRSALSVAVALVANGLSIQAVYAQSTQNQSADIELEEVVVTGSRVRSGTTTTPVPVTAISQEDLLAATPANLADSLKQLPAMAPGGGPTAGGGTRAGGQQFLNLRGLGSDRNLILLDGRRMVMADPRNLVDVNLIPQGLVSRVDVVTGGASAAYGSDAVAGVANFVLNRKFEGFKLDVYRGMSEYGDNHEYKVSPTFGFDLMDGRLNITGSVDHVDNEGLPGTARGHRVTAPNQIPDPNNRSMLVRARDLRTPFTDGSLIVTGVGGSAAANAQFQGVMFTENGPASYNYGLNSTTRGSTSGSQDGGDGYRVSTGQEIIRPLRRTNGYLGANYELSDSTSLFGSLILSDTLSDHESSASRHTFNISRGNPYLAAAAPQIVDRMYELGVTQLRVNRLIPELGLTITDNSNKTVRYLVGIESEIGEWTWEASAQYGRNDNNSVTHNNFVTENLDRALNTVTDPSGEIVCADTLSSNTAVAAAAAGCVPFNPFGLNSPSPAALAYVNGRSEFETRNEQTAAEFSFSGPLMMMSTSGEQVMAAFGAEWRDIGAVTTVDPLSDAGAYRLINQQPFDASYSVKEAFAEFQIPLLADMTMIESMDLNVAARITDYSTSGSVNTWKTSVSWQITEDFRLRGTLSSDIRAPSLEELFANGRQNNITIVDELTNQSYFNVPNKTFGNSNLVPEEATTKVVGFVYQPSWLEGLDIAIDYYDIKIEDAITNIGGGNAVTLCNQSSQQSPACDLVVREPGTNAVIGTFTSPVNLAEVNVEGVDVETVYRTALDFGPGGNLTLRLVGGYVDHLIQKSPLIPFPENVIGSARQSSQPHVRANLSARYELDRLSLYAQARYIGSFTWDKRLQLGVGTDFNYIPSEIYVDSEVRYTFNFGQHELQTYLNISNLLNKGLVYSPSTGGATPTPTNTGLYDQVGRMYRLGFRYSF